MKEQRNGEARQVEAEAREIYQGLTTEERAYMVKSMYEKAPPEIGERVWLAAWMITAGLPAGV